MRNKLRLIILTILIASFSVFAISDQSIIKRVEQVYGHRAGLRVKTWHKILNQARALPEIQKLKKINNFFNQLYFISDKQLWGVKDYWATPLEFLGANAGDCEDFSLAKYYSLRELNVKDSKLRLVYVKALKLNQFHMVVAYYPKPSSIPLILDNIDKRIMKATARKDLLPIFSFNGSKLWLMKQNGQGREKGNSSSLSRWTDLQSRESNVRLKRPKINYYQ